jgi:salicylate hydroxylase
VQFANGQCVEADYVVACDGVASAIRQQMIGDQSHYLGLAAIVGDAPITLEHPLLAGGYFMTLGKDGSSVFCYRQAGGVHLSYTTHVASVDSLRSESPEALLKRVQQATQDWHAPIPAIAAAIDPATEVVRGYYDKEPLKHVHEGHVWLIGDAAHPMSPFQGQGANMAMVDALRLAQFFTDSADIAEEIEKLDKDIVTRGRKAVLESRQAATQFHNRSSWQQGLRNFGFRISNRMIKLFARR